VTTKNAVAAKRCCACKVIKAVTPTERFLAIIDKVALPTLNIPPAWSVGPMAGTA
jgi:hypothetical protein